MFYTSMEYFLAAQLSIVQWFVAWNRSYAPAIHTLEYAVAFAQETNSRVNQWSTLRLDYIVERYPAHAPHLLIAQLIGRYPEILLFATAISHTHLHIILATRSHNFHDGMMSMTIVYFYTSPQAFRQTICLDRISLAVSRFSNHPATFTDGTSYQTAAFAAVTDTRWFIHPDGTIRCLNSRRCWFLTRSSLFFSDFLASRTHHDDTCTDTARS